MILPQAGLELRTARLVRWPVLNPLSYQGLLTEKEKIESDIYDTKEFSCELKMFNLLSDKHYWQMANSIVQCSR